MLDVSNNIKPAIQFITETSDTQLPFLGMMMNKEGEKVFIDIYSKLTDSKRYATQKDMSPSNQTTLSIAWKTSFKFFLARRVCMITEKDSLK